jgi:uncharacterized protein (DUF2147 family)
MKKLLFATLALFFSVISYAQIEGKWKTIDDETGKPKSIVEIFKKSDGKYYGKIFQLLVKPEHETCVKCTDDRKNKPVLGLEIIRGLKKEGEEFTGGTITDPKNGKTYKCTIKKSGDELDVRGFIGFSFIGRSQTWYKAK